jgi:hypothetical protein
MRFLVLLIAFCSAYIPSKRKIPHIHGSSLQPTEKYLQMEPFNSKKAHLQRSTKTVAIHNDESAIVQSLRMAPDASSFTSILHAQALQRTPLNNLERLAIVWETLPWCSKLTVHQSASVLWSIGTLKLPLRNSQVVQICDVILNTLCAGRSSMTAADMSLSLFGLARLVGRGTLNNMFPAIASNETARVNVDNFHSFLSSLGHLAPYMDEQQIANSVWALGKIGMSWESFDSRTIKAICESIQSRSPLMTSQGISNSIHGVKHILI